MIFHRFSGLSQPCHIQRNSLCPLSKVVHVLFASESSELNYFSSQGFPKKEKKLEKKIQNEEQLYDDLRNYYNTVVSNNESIYSPGPARSPQPRPQSESESSHQPEGNTNYDKWQRKARFKADQNIERSVKNEDR